MAKCEICKNKVGENFLNKVLGTYIKDEKGKKYLVCSVCQSHLTTKDAVLDKILEKP